MDSPKCSLQWGYLFHNGGLPINPIGQGWKIVAVVMELVEFLGFPSKFFLILGLVLFKKNPIESN